MCGIAGLVSFTAARPDKSLAVQLSTALAHRGPDGEGSFASAGVLLVHRRLAIIDPSPAAAQPMSAEHGRYQLVFNGEVYNHRELRRELEQHGEVFRTVSDTEVLLRLLVREGPAGLARVRGMFALALWDERDRTLLLARDRFGIKPLYVTSNASRVAFASEIGALRASGLAARDISPAGVLAYLSWASIPAPLTWLRDVAALEPGTWSRWDQAGVQATGTFADAREPYIDAPEINEEELRARAAVAIRDSVRAHLVADVPVGVFLSGGIDSGALLSAAHGATSGTLNSYTIVVDEAEYSEAAVAARVAARFGASHHELRVDARAIREDLSTIVRRLDQPTGDAVNSFYVSRAVASTGVKAVLSGVGGDELFGGYPSFERVPAMLQVSGTLGPAMRATGAAAVLALPAWRAAKWQHFAAETGVGGAYRALRGFFMPAELPALLGPALSEASDAAQVEAAEASFSMASGPESIPAAVARMETRGFLRAQLLRDIDAMSMAHGLEVRVPFVDHELQQAIWPALGHHRRLLKGKRLLHESLAQPLPADVIERPKRGFTLPFESWMRHDLRDSTRDGLAALASQGWIAVSAPEMVWDAFDRGQAHWSRAWGLAMLGRFLTEAP